MSNWIKFLITFLILTAFATSFGFNFYLQNQIADLRLQIEDQVSSEDSLFSKKYEGTACDTNCKNEVKDYMAEILASSSSYAVPLATPTPKPQVQKTTAVVTTPKVVYIPLGGAANTQNTDWTTLDNAQIWLDFNGDYGQKASATWDAFLKVENANGTVYARLYDATHGIAVNGSEISVTNNANFTQSISSALSLWSGRNLYKVQIKSLNSFPVYFDSGRIKITY